MIKNIVFDVGDVLLSYRWRDMMIQDHGLAPKDAERIAAEMFNSPYWAILDLGTETEEQVLHGYDQIYPEDSEHIRWFITHGEKMHVGRPDVWERVHELKHKGYKLYYLSNYSYELFSKHTKGAPFMEDMSGGVVSYQIHISKPDRRIYEYLLSKYDLKPEECLFFDDRMENVEGARKAGMNSERVISEAQLVEMLDELLKNKD